MGNTYTGSNSGKAGLEVTEVDGTPDVFGVGKIIVSNGTLTDDGGGTVTITTGGGGGGAVTSVGMGTTGLTPAAAANRRNYGCRDIGCSKWWNRSNHTDRRWCAFRVGNRGDYSTWTTC